VIAWITIVTGAVAAAATSDIPGPEKRKAIVDTAARLSRIPEVAALPESIPNPFSPAGFDQAEGAQPRQEKGISQPLSDRELLNAIAERIAPSGTMLLNGEPWLIFSKKRMHVGDHITVTFGAQDYDLELTAIDRTTFTIRLNSEETTRPIKPGKTQ
jgi:hypothetical protein